MKIETRYNIGQEVWFLSEGESYKGIVKSISISAMEWKDGISVDFNYLITQEKNSPFSLYRDENSLFPNQRRIT